MAPPFLSLGLCHWKEWVPQVKLVVSENQNSDLVCGEGQSLHIVVLRGIRPYHWIMKTKHED